MDSLRWFLLGSLALQCASTSLACGKSGEPEAKTPDQEVKNKPKPDDPPPEPPKKKDAYAVTGPDKQCGGCPCGKFCTWDKTSAYPEPDLSKEPDTENCPTQVKVPKETNEPGLVNSIAYIDYELTKKKRTGDVDVCCYTYSNGPCGKGRPLRDGDAMVVACDAPDRGWSSRIDLGNLEALDRETRVALGAHFRRMGHFEHASVASFARASMELMALGAPADLIEETHRAALDEVAHARVAYAIATALDGAALGPGPLALPASPPIDPARIAEETFVDAAIHEALGCVFLVESAKRTQIPALAPILDRLASDEARHAALGLRIVRFVLDGMQPVERIATLSKLRARLEAERPSIAWNDVALPSELQHELSARALRELAAPTLDMLEHLAA